jgi:hypothetical protein
MANSLLPRNNALTPQKLNREYSYGHEVGGPGFRKPWSGVAEGYARQLYKQPGDIVRFGELLTNINPARNFLNQEHAADTFLQAASWVDDKLGTNYVEQAFQDIETKAGGPSLQRDMAQLLGMVTGPEDVLVPGAIAAAPFVAKGLGKFGDEALQGLVKTPLDDQIGAITYHGSPHKFDRFKHEFMGSGEGAQAYGWGTYLADNPDVAGMYQKTVKPKGLERLQSRLDFAKINNNHEQIAHFQKQIDEFPISSNLYEVDLPDEQIGKMLDWDAPLSEQPEAVKKLFNQYADDIPELGKRNPKGDFVKTDLIEEDLILTAENDSRLYNKPEVFRAIEKYKQNPADMTTRRRLIRYFDDYPYDHDSYPNFLAEREAEYAGSNTGELYKRIAAKIGKHDPNAVLQTDELSDGQRILSEALNAEGIPGIKYWDGGSRQAGSGTRNYVVFDEDIMTILKRNDELLNADTVSD